MTQTRKNKYLFWVQKIAVIIILALITSLGYLSINRMHDGEKATFLPTVIDSMIPYNRHWVWFYYLYFPFIFLPFLFLRNRKELYRAFAFFLITAVITLTFYLFWRTGINRPKIIDEDLSARLLKAIYREDNPYNCFPSQHVAYSWTAALIFYKRNRIYGYIGFFIALCISLSTLFIKQHWFVDFPGGIAVAFLGYFLTYKAIFKDKKIDNE